MKAFKCTVDFDNGAKVEKVTMIVFADNPFLVSKICEEKLCKHYDESVTSATMEEIQINDGDAFIIEDK